YWVRHLRQTVRFSDGISQLLRESDNALLEVGPGQNLSALAKMQAETTQAQTVISTMRHPYERQSDVAFLLTALGKLWLVGANVNWSAVQRGWQCRRVPLPTYPFARERYWIEPQREARSRGVAEGKRSDIADWFYLPSWKR